MVPLGFFPIDGEALNYLRLTGRDDDRVALVEAYAKAQGMWRDSAAADPHFTDILSLDLSKWRRRWQAQSGPRPRYAA